MSNPISIIPVKPRVRRKRRAVGVAGPAGLVLMSASFDGDTHFLTVTFDRAIDISAIDPGQFSVIDQSGTESTYLGNADGAGVGDATLTLLMDVTGPAEGTQVLLTVGEANGIVAAAPPVGGTWPGGTVALPSP